MSLPPCVQAMLAPAFYDHPTRNIRLMQTHASWIVLTGDYAYKVKKPVDFGFLDYSTLERRRAMCRKELELNRRLAPELYLTVLPIRKSGHDYLLDGEQGRIVEYCLKMIQFDPEALLAAAIDTGRFDPRWFDDLARQLAAFHGAAEVAPDPRFGSAALLGHYMDENLAAARRLDRHADSPVHAGLEHGATRMLATLGDRLERRRRDGHIRACHGDLHLGNIALVAGRPRIFDCIEFNDELRLIDTMNDAAFLAMDCDARGHPELGLRFLSRYLEHGGDYEGLALLRLYQCYRAGVRGKVALLLSEDANISGNAAAAKRREGEAYFRLAASYGPDERNGRKPHLYAVGGLSGSGKSHLAMLGSAAEHALVIRSDATRKRLGADAEALYTPAMTEATYQAMMHGADAALAAGFSVILDATFLDAAHREEARALAKGHGIPLRLYWLDIPAAELRRRVRERSAHGGDVSDADLTVLEAQLGEYRRPVEADIVFLKASEAWPDL